MRCKGLVRETEGRKEGMGGGGGKGRDGRNGRGRGGEREMVEQDKLKV